MINDNFNEIIKEINKLYDNIKIQKYIKNLMNVNQGERMMIEEINNKLKENSYSFFIMLKNG